MPDWLRDAIIDAKGIMALAMITRKDSASKSITLFPSEWFEVATKKLDSAMERWKVEKNRLPYAGFKEKGEATAYAQCLAIIECTPFPIMDVGTMEAARRAVIRLISAKRLDLRQSAWSGESQRTLKKQVQIYKYFLSITAFSLQQSNTSGVNYVPVRRRDRNHSPARAIGRSSKESQGPQGSTAI